MLEFLLVPLLAGACPGRTTATHQSSSHRVFPGFAASVQASVLCTIWNAPVMGGPMVPVKMLMSFPPGGDGRVPFGGMRSGCYATYARPSRSDINTAQGGVLLNYPMGPPDLAVYSGQLDVNDLTTNGPG